MTGVFTMTGVSTVTRVTRVSIMTGVFIMTGVSTVTGVSIVTGASTKTEPLPNLEKLKENVSEQPATITTENKCRIKRDKGKQEGEKNILEDSTI